MRRLLDTQFCEPSKVCKGQHCQKSQLSGAAAHTVRVGAGGQGPSKLQTMVTKAREEYISRIDSFAP